MTSSTWRGFWVLAAALAATMSAACGGDRPGPRPDGGGGVDAGPGIACGSTTCAAGRVCCIDCDGTGNCGPVGTACPGYACFPDAGPGDAGPGIACGSTTCAAGQICCIDCDGAGSCGPPGSACPGFACPDAGVNPGGCTPGTCRLSDAGACEEPSGPTGNGCCECGSDSTCTSLCRCAAPDTPVATPDGDRPIASLAPGDLVYTINAGRILVAPLARTHRAPVPLDHVMVRLSLANGSVLAMSPGHPTADGRAFAELASGDSLSGVGILNAERVPYDHAFTYDILPASDTGAYQAAGAWVGSTLAGGRGLCLPSGE